MRQVLVRHALRELDSPNILRAEFRRAAQVGEELGSRGFELDQILVGPQLRHYQTAVGLSRGTAKTVEVDFLDEAPAHLRAPEARERTDNGDIDDELLELGRRALEGLSTTRIEVAVTSGAIIAAVRKLTGYRPKPGEGYTPDFLGQQLVFVPYKSSSLEEIKPT